MSEAGYVRIYRSLLGHHVFRNDAEAMAFAWMVIRAQWKPAKVRYKDRIIALNRGQLAVSVRDMAAALDRDKAWIERLWKRLKSETMIQTVSETGVTVVTICNYGEYQASQDNGETPRETGSETSARQARDTEQRREEGKKIEEEAKASPSKTRARAEAPKSVPLVIPDWMPADAWNGFIEMRIAKGATPTNHAIQLLIRKLDGFRARGHDPTAVLDQSTINRWTDIYEIKDNRNGSRNQASDRDPDAWRAGAQPRPAAGFERRAFEARSRETAGATERHPDREAGGDRELPLAPARLVPGR